jgi:D-alanine-D-alanine ligase
VKRRLKVTVLLDWPCVPDDDPQLLREPRDPATEYHVASTLRELGHHVTVLGVSDLQAMVGGLREQEPDIVFNLTEEFRGDRRHDRNLAAVLEVMGVPFTGSGSAGLMLCRSKGLCKQLLNFHRIRVPGFLELPAGRRVRVPRTLRYPMVVKPLYEDGSEGIFNASLVRTEEALVERVRIVHERFEQPAIAEEYVAGRELYVAVLGNTRLAVLPPRELFLRQQGNGAPVLATYSVKWNAEYREKWGVRFGFAEVSPGLMARLARICRRVYRSLELRDYARIDLRVTPEEEIVVLEVNPNPDIAHGEDVAEAAERAGIPYPRFIQRLLRLALARWGA